MSCKPLRMVPTRGLLKGVVLTVIYVAATWGWERRKFNIFDKMFEEHGWSSAEGWFNNIVARIRDGGDKVVRQSKLACCEMVQAHGSDTWKELGEEGHESGTKEETVWVGKTWKGNGCACPPWRYVEKRDGLAWSGPNDAEGITQQNRRALLLTLILDRTDDCLRCSVLWCLIDTELKEYKCLLLLHNK